MATTKKSAAGAREEEMSSRMKRFVDSVIQEVEETGIDDKYAAEADSRPRRHPA